MWYRSIRISSQNRDVYHQALDIPVSSTLQNILNTFVSNDKRARIVGGSVRDALQGMVPKDIDVEVYGTSYDDLVSMLSSFGQIDVVGKSFGVIKFRDEEGNDFDFSIPRRENKKGVGHKGFKVSFDPTITPKEAASRRDFTINALAYDPISQEIHDYYNGVNDLESKILRHTSPAFAEDPLRVLRGMQFAARFGMDMAPETAELCQNMIKDYDAERPAMIEHYVNGGRQEMIEHFREEREEKIAQYMMENPNASPKDAEKRFPDNAEKLFPQDPEQMFAKDIHSSLALERISEEWMKLATKGKYPGRVLQILQDTGWIQFYPELSAIIGVPQDSEWHPEGEVGVHTAHVMDAAAEIADRDGLQGDDRAVLIFAAMGHDLAKATTTEQREKGGKLRWTAHGHEEASGPVAEQLLKSMGIKSDIIQRVRPIIERHLEHIRFDPDKVTPGQVRQLADAIHPGTIEELAKLMEADSSGRPPLPKGLPEQARLMLEYARQDGSNAGKPESLVQGRDVMPYFQGKGGPHIGTATKDAYQAQIKGKFTTVEEARNWLDNYIKGRASLVRGDQVLPYYDGKGGPHVADVLNQAWSAQRAGEFTDSDSASAWLAQFMTNRQSPQPDQELQQ